MSNLLKQRTFKEQSETRQDLNNVINSNLAIIYNTNPELSKTAESQLLEEMFAAMKAESFASAKDVAASQHENYQYIIFNLSMQRHDLMNFILLQRKMY